MSRICQGCGGVLGRDCWNEQDCIQISQSMNDQNQDLLYEINELKELFIETVYRAQFMLPTNDRDLERFDQGADINASDYVLRMTEAMKKYHSEAFIEDDENITP